MTRAACLQSIYELAKQDKRVVFIGSDLSANTMLEFKRDFPDRFFMEGIQEQNIISMAAGLALEGFIPYVNNIATFLTRRCYEQIIIDICAHKLPVRLCGNGGGLVYSPLGLTHCAVDDLAIMRALPNMSVVACSDSEEMKAFMPTTIAHRGPMYIRLGIDNDPVLQPTPYTYIAEKLKGIVFISTGIMTHKINNIIEILDSRSIVIHCPYIKPFQSPDMLSFIHHTHEMYGKAKMIVTAEEGIINGGLGSAVLEYLADNNIQIPVLRFGLPDAFPHHYGERDDLLETYGLTPDKMAKRVKEFYDAL